MESPRRKVFTPSVDVDEEKTTKKKFKREDEPKKVVVVEKQPKQAGFFTWQVIWILCTSVLVMIVSHVIVRYVTTSNQQSVFEPWPVTFYNKLQYVHPALTNTTTQEDVWKTRQSLIHHMTETYRDRYPCLCQHHLTIPSNVTCVRICAIYNEHQFYLLINPRAVGFTKKNATTFREYSCNETYLRKRLDTVFFEWEDERSITHYLAFQGRSAACLQLAMEEFRGTRDHCTNDS